MPAEILITGDLVLDHHLYEGTKPSPGAGRDTGDGKVRSLKEKVEWGGANLLGRLLKEAERAEVEEARKADEKAKAQKKTEGEKTKEAGAGKAPEVEKVEEVKTYLPQTNTSLLYGDLVSPQLPDPSALPIDVAHGYALFSPMERNPPKEKDRVWRVSKVLGYGSSTEPDPNRSISFSPPKATPRVICLDDAGDQFRNSSHKDLWCLPKKAGKKELPWIVHKVSGDLEGESEGLWSALEKRTDLRRRLVVLVAAQELREMKVRLSRGLSWERSVEHLLWELTRHRALKNLTKWAHHLIVHFGIDAALWIEGIQTADPKTVLVFDAAHAEVEWSEINAGEGRAFAYQTCLAAAVCRDLAIAAQKNGTNFDVSARARALGAGLSTMRLLRLDGHGKELDKAKNPVSPNGFPIPALAEELLKPKQSFSHVVVPDTVWKSAKQNPNSGWTILSQIQRPQQTRLPLYDLARQVVLRGEVALKRLPHLRIEKLLTTQRTDMEALRSLRRLFNAYKSPSNSGKKPLSIGIFGPPGAGKSFAVKELTVGMFAPGAEEYAGWREFNLSQFNGSEDLIGAFHQVRDLVLQRLIPVVFWDEFDASNYKWLQYLLAPMQDGRFQQGEATHTIGKCIFIFAGGTAWTFDSFGVFSADPSKDQLFRLAKGPDFKSRLDGVYDVQGPNRRLIPPADRKGKPKHAAAPTKWKEDTKDIYFPIRRAIMIRSLMCGKSNERIEFDPGLLTALLQADCYVHGARSLEKVIESLKQRKNLMDQSLPPVRSALPAPEQLRLHVKTPEAFHKVCSEYVPPFDPSDITDEMIELLAERIHARWLEGVLARGENKPDGKPWEQLSEKAKNTNKAAARRIPEILSMIGLSFVPGKASPEKEKKVRDYLALYLDFLAEDEHERWMDHEKSQGVDYGETRDDKHHPCMKPFQQLPAFEQDKDRDTILRYPELARSIGYKIAFVEEPKKS